MGDFFEVQLEALDKVGAELLPGGADAYRNAKARLDDTEAAFAGELFDVVNGDIADVQDQFVILFGHLAKDLDLSAEAILEIARRYREADQQDTDTPSAPSSSSPEAGSKKQPGADAGMGSIEEDLNHLSDLLGQLVPATNGFTDVVNVGSSILQPGGAIITGGFSPISDGAQWLSSETGNGAITPYPVDDLRKAFTPPTEGSSAPAEQLKGDITAAQTALIEDFEATIGSVKETMTGWSGDAAENFKDYIANVVDAKDLHLAALQAAWAITDIYGKVIDAAHTDVQALLDESIATAEEMLAGKQSAMVTTAVTGVATAAAAVASGGASAVIGILGWAASGIASASVPSSAASPEDLPGAIIEAANTLTDEITGRVDQCKEQLGTLVGVLGGGEMTDNLTQVQPEEPLILSGTTFEPSEFGLPDDQEPGGIEDEVDTSGLTSTGKPSEQSNDPAPVG